MLDSNALGGVADDAAVEQLIELAERLQVAVSLPFSVQAEIGHPNTPRAVKLRAVRLIYSVEVNLTAEESRRRELVRAILRGNAAPGKHDRDALHLFEAAKYGRYFITNDRRFTDKAQELGEHFPGLHIVNPAEFLEIVDRYPALPVR